MVVKQFKLAYPHLGELHSQMYDSEELAAEQLKDQPLGMLMELNSADVDGNYSWTVIRVGVGWYILALVLGYSMFKRS